MSVKRRARSTIAAAICAGLVLSGCSSNDSTDEAATSKVAEDVTIEHARGTDTYPANPQNVVAVGPAVDNLLELGIKPAAVVQNAKDKNSPWREGKLDGVKVIDQADFKTLPQEQIAAINKLRQSNLTSSLVTIGQYLKIITKNCQPSHRPSAASPIKGRGLAGRHS